MIESLVHDLSELELLGGVELAKWVLGLIEHLLFFEDAVSVLI